MSFQQHIESHKIRQHRLRIERFVPGQSLWLKILNFGKRQCVLFKARLAFKKFARANLSLEMAEMDAKHTTTPAGQLKAQRSLRKAKKTYEIAKRQFEPR